MKLAKKSLALLAGLTCVASMGVTGCNPSKDSVASTTPTETASPAESTEPAESTAPALEPVTITWYQAGATNPEDLSKVVEAANKYIAENTELNCTLDLQMFDFGTFPDKIQTMISSGENFDICFTANWCNSYFQQSAKGAFVALNDDKQLLHTYAPKTEEMLGADFLAGSQINGINYAIPANKEKAHQWGLLVRSDIVEKYNMDLSGVKKLADMEPFFKQVKEGEGGNMYAFEALTGESPFRLLDFDRIGDEKYPGVVYNDDASKVINELEAPETLELFKLLNSFYKAGYIREDAATITDYTVDQKAGKMFAATRSLKPGKDAEESNSMGVPYTQIELTPAIISNRETTGSMQAISSTSKNPERALMLLELFNTDPYFNNLLNFGIEGEHYTKVSENVISKGPSADKYSLGLGWAFGNQFINYLWDNEDAEKWDKFKAFNDGAKGTQTLGFVYDSSAVTTEIAQCANLWDQYIPSLETGTVDPEQLLPEAIAAFKAAGADTIIADKQKQLDDWKAAK